jgi:hypothetical protein
MLVKEALKPALRTVDAIMSKFGIGKKDAQKFLSSKFTRNKVIDRATGAAAVGGLWAASNFMKAKLGVYPVVAGKSGSKTSPVSKPKSKPKSKGIGTDQGKVNRGGGPRLFKKKGTSAFDKAFRAARDAGKMSFMWQGKRVKTNIANPDKSGKKVNEKIVTRGAGKRG